MLKFFLGLLCIGGLFAAEKKEIPQGKAVEGIISFDSHQKHLNGLFNAIQKQTAVWSVNDIIWQACSSKFQVGTPKDVQDLLRLPHGEVEGYRSSEECLGGSRIITHRYPLILGGKRVVVEDSVELSLDKKSFIERSIWMKLRQVRKPGTYWVSAGLSSNVVEWNYYES